MREYAEISSASELAASLDCFWTMWSDQAYIQRVLPDACAEILFRRYACKSAVYR
jgi:Domain of unknown function (DUF6597)